VAQAVACAEWVVVQPLWADVTLLPSEVQSALRRAASAVVMVSRVADWLAAPIPMQLALKAAIEGLDGSLPREERRRSATADLVPREQHHLLS
jgi:hypothetical protein